MSLEVSVLDRLIFLSGGSKMPTITKKQLEDYQQLCKDRTNGRILTADGLRFICEAHNYDAEAIGKHMLETLARMQAKENR